MSTSGECLQPRYPGTYYGTRSPPSPVSAPLQGSTRSDICIVGGGIAGCAAALALSERGHRVVLLEAEHLGWGASGRNGGQVLPGLAADQADLESSLGPGDARALWELSIEAVALLKRRLERHRIDCDWVSGQMFTAIRPRQWRALQEWQRVLEQRYDYHGTQLLAREQLRELLGSERYVGALLDGHSGHLDPLRYTLGLARAAITAGTRLHERSRMTHFETAGDAVRVHTAGGRVDCRCLVLAGNAWLGRAVPSLQRTLMAVASFVIATAPLGEQRARELIGNNAAVCDTNWVLDYFRRTADHRLLFGGRVSYSGAERAIGPATARRMLKVFPQLAGVPIDYAWGCLLDITRNRAPHFGRLAPNVYFLQGFSGHGLALAGMAGELVAEAVDGTAARFDVFARIPHRPFPGGAALRRPALMLAMLWYRLRDLLP